LFQVDYAKDKVWNAWNQDALRCFLTGGDANFLSTQPLHPTTKVLSPQRFITPSSTSTIQESWVQQSKQASDDSMPTCFDEKPDLDGLDMLFGDCDQVLAMEEEIWEISTVSAITNRGCDRR
jgi:hypothetical protein